MVRFPFWARSMPANASHRKIAKLQPALLMAIVCLNGRSRGSRGDRVKPAVMIVTGGARGIGAATARLAAARGFAVCVNYQQNREAAESVVRDIESNGGVAIAVQADVSSEAGVLSLFERVDPAWG